MQRAGRALLLCFAVVVLARSLIYSAFSLLFTFFGVGGCDFPLMTGYVHVINPRLMVSFKMGSPLRTVGVINADVSTCIAGWLDRKPDMMPMRVMFRPDAQRPAQTFNVEVARQRSMMPNFVHMVLTNAVDMEGDLPEEVTARVKVRFELEDRPPLVLDDQVSGPQLTGPRGPQALYSTVAPLVQLLTNNTFATPPTVSRGGVDKVHSHVQCRLQSADGFSIIGVLTPQLTAAENPCANSHDRSLNLRSAQCSILHTTI